MALLTPIPSWIYTIKEDYSSSSKLQKLRKQFDEREHDLTFYTDNDGFIFYEGQICIAADSTLRHTILRQLHESPTRGTQDATKNLRG